MKNLKKLLLEALVGVSLLSCSNLSDLGEYRYWHNIDSDKIQEVREYCEEENEKGISTSEAINNWIWNQENIEYVSDEENYGQVGYWALPSETLLSKKGDCEDKVLVGLALYYNITREEGSLLIGKLGTNSGYHAIADYNGNIYCENFEITIEIDWIDIWHNISRKR